jgi:hypothetical protein
MSTNAATMESERAAKVATERVKIEAADKVNHAKADKEAKAERERVKATSAERAKKDAAKPAAPAKKKGGKATPVKVTDVDLLAAVKKAVAKDKDLSKSGAVKAVRQSGISAAGKRIRAAYEQATKSAKATKKNK